MLTRDKVVRILQEERTHLAAEFGVSRIGLFGSYAKGQPAESSDVDILVAAGVKSIRNKRVARSIAESVVYV